jgi:hypothetical protein
VLSLCMSSLLVREVTVDWKKQVVRPASNSFQMKEFVGKRFLPESVQHQLQTLRLPNLACWRDPERRLAPMDCACEGVYSQAE